VGIVAQQRRSGGAKPQALRGEGLAQLELPILVSCNLPSTTTRCPATLPMITTLYDFRIQFLEVLESEKTFKEAFYYFCWNMRATDEEIEVCVALNLLSKRKREDEVPTDSDSSPSVKNQSPRLFPKAVEQCSGHEGSQPPDCMMSRACHQISADGVLDSNRQKITKESLLTVRDRLCSLTIKNQEIRKSIQSLRKSVIEDLYSHMKVSESEIEDKIHSTYTSFRLGKLPLTSLDEKRKSRMTCISSAPRSYGAGRMIS
jgi:hypothetical protein